MASTNSVRSSVSVGGRDGITSAQGRKLRLQVEHVIQDSFCPQSVLFLILTYNFNSYIFRHFEGSPLSNCKVTSTNNSGESQSVSFLRKFLLPPDSSDERQFSRIIYVNQRRDHLY
jgi:hypothetical protein